MRVGAEPTRMADYFEQDDSGKIRQKYSDEDFIDAVEAHEPASTKEVADAVGCSRRNADARLRTLEDAGQVRSKMVGNSLTWLLSSE